MTHEVDAGRLTEVEAAVKVSEYIQKTLKCATVSFWGVYGTVGERVMRRVAGYDGVRGAAVTTPIEAPEAGGTYFGTLARPGCFVSADTFADPNLAGAVDTMLAPLEIRSLLSTAWGSNGEVWGVIACTDRVVRRWLPAEVTALRKCASEISMRRARRRARRDDPA
jgi:GAF domain-containing protein